MKMQELLKREEKSGLFVSFFVAGYPDSHRFLDIIEKSEKSGVDIFEIGFPSSNPYADGKIIKDAHIAVDRKICSDLNYWKKIRQSISKPIWVMAYKTDFIDTNIYLDFAKEGLADAFVLPDCTQEERKRLSVELSQYGVYVLGFANPEMSVSDWKDCFENFDHVYIQLYAGPTGMQVDSSQYHNVLEFALQYESVKSFAGFGIKTPNRVQSLIEEGFSGVVIGTAMVEKLNDSHEALYKFINEMKRVTKGR